MKNRPKYYIGRSFLIYFLTLFSGTVISSFIFAYFEPFGPVSSNYVEDLLAYMFLGLMTTSICCIPILFILICGFWFIYSRYENDQQKWKNLINLSIICITIPLIIFFSLGTFGVFVVRDTNWTELIPWFLSMISYALFGIFFILYISNKADLRHPPDKMGHLNNSGLEDILDIGFDSDFEA